MANSNAPTGLQPVDNLGQVNITGRVRPYIHPSSDGNALYIGDAVATLASSGDSSYGLSPITIATAGVGNAIRGVVVAVDPVIGNYTTNLNLGITYAPASTAAIVYVCDDPNQLYSIQSSGTVANGDVGQNANLSTSVAGSTSTGMSGMQLLESSIGAGATGQLKVMGQDTNQNNAMSAANTRVIVKINNHELASGTGTAGV